MGFGLLFWHGVRCGFVSGRLLAFVGSFVLICSYVLWIGCERMGLGLARSAVTLGLHRGIIHILVG